MQKSNQSRKKQPDRQKPAVERKPYSPPKLRHYGKVADLTTGGSIGVGDSGNFQTQRPLEGRGQAGGSGNSGPPR